MRTELILKTAKALGCLFIGAGALSACAIKQNVVPVSLTSGEEICVVHDGTVRDTVEPVIVSALRDQGYGVRVVTDFNDPTCTNKLTYWAKWSWDVTIYMSVAELKYFQLGAKTGEATYDSRSGGANMGKFIDAETKLREMIDELFVD